jgi:hypothetical protein
MRQINCSSAANNIATRGFRMKERSSIKELIPGATGLKIHLIIIHPSKLRLMRLAI